MSKEDLTTAMQKIGPYRNDPRKYAELKKPNSISGGDQKLLAETCIAFGKRVENKEITKEQSDYYHSHKQHLLELLHPYDSAFVLPDDEEMMAISHHLKRTYRNHYYAPNDGGSFNYDSMHQLPVAAYGMSGLN